MNGLNWLKKLIWENKDEDEGYRAARRQEAELRPESCAGKVVLVKPGCYINVGLLTSYLCAGYLVMVDLSGVSEEGGARIIDFLSGAAYARDGVMMQVSSKAYLLAPSCVSVDDWDQVKDDVWAYDNVFNF